MQTVLTTRWRPGFAVTLAVGAATALAACSSLAPPRKTVAGTIEQRAERLAIAGGTLEIHLARRTPDTVGGPLVVFASGDVGWFGAATGMFDTIAAAGYPVVGLSSKALLRGLRTAGQPLSTARVIATYGDIIGAGQRAFNLPANHDVILAGWSRGASISVIVAAEQPRVPWAGVVAIGLAANENLNVDLDSDEDNEPGSTSHGEIDTYALMRAMAGRVAVIQASGDSYLRASRARELFGADSAGRRFYAVDASNHRFSGGAAGFRTALNDALNWIKQGSGIGDQGSGELK